MATLTLPHTLASSRGREATMTFERFMHRMLFVATALLVVVACGGGREHDTVDQIHLAATVPASFVDEVVATGLSSPTAMTFAPDGRLFVCQQGGQVRVIKSGALLSTPFTSVTTTTSG